jgi:hypothetical protein
MDLFRAVPKQQLQPGARLHRVPGRRLPANIPYPVDNLWEFTRPPTLPSRRHAVYASTSPALALKNASAVKGEADAYVACRIEFHIRPPMVQLSVPDAREHSDVGHLQKLINERLRQWAGAEVPVKQPLAALFLPGVTKHELLIAMEASVLLADLVAEAAAKVGLWQAAPVADGELFFEIAEDNFYVLQPL